MKFAQSMILAVIGLWGMLALPGLSLAIEIEGVYRGTMHLVDGYERDIPLQFSLIFSNETTVGTDGEEQRIIDSAFVVDDEGGPYTFTKVTFDLESGRLDFRYSRPQSDILQDAPAAFRLTGNLNRDGTISGRVVSGYKGPLGTFTASRSDQTALIVTQKYTGEWGGEAIMLPNQDNPRTYKLSAGLKLQESSRMSSKNPPTFEFEYTPGRIGGFYIGGIEFSFMGISIDYLRRRMYLSHGTVGDVLLSLDLEIDPETKMIKGFHDSFRYGRTSQLTLKPGPIP